MRLHGVKDTEFEIYYGDTLTNDWDFLRETNPAKMPKFYAIVANPPFSYRWEPKEDMGDDVRFKNHSLAHPPPTSPSSCTASTTSKIEDSSNYCQSQFVLLRKVS